MKKIYKYHGRNKITEYTVVSQEEFLENYTYKDKNNNSTETHVYAKITSSNDNYTAVKKELLTRNRLTEGRDGHIVAVETLCNTWFGSKEDALEWLSVKFDQLARDYKASMEKALKNKQEVLKNKQEVLNDILNMEYGVDCESKFIK